MRREICKQVRNTLARMANQLPRTRERAPARSRHGHIPKRRVTNQAVPRESGQRFLRHHQPSSLIAPSPLSVYLVVPPS